MTLRDHIQRAALIDERAEEALDGSDFDDSVGHIWHWWLELHTTRSDANQKLKWSETLAYFQLRRIDPLREEIILLEALEDEYLTYRHEQWKQQEEERLKKQQT